MSEESKIAWRRKLAAAARSSLDSAPPPYKPVGPFRVRYRWSTAARVEEFVVDRFEELYQRLLNLAYYPRLPRRWLPLGLRLQNLLGRQGLALARLLWEKNTPADLAIRSPESRLLRSKGSRSAGP